MAVTDQQVLNEVQAQLIETQDNGATWSSGEWTAQEVIVYLNQRQFAFLKETGIVLKRATISTNPMVFRHPLPTDWIGSERVVWKSSDSTPVFTEIPRSDGYEADHFILDWPNNAAAQPRAYTDGELPTLQIETFPAANVSGQLQILYLALSTTLSNSGVAFSVPDEFTPAVKWGVIADMLGKTSRAQDVGRMQYAEQRYREGIMAAKLILGGWS